MPESDSGVTLSGFSVSCRKHSQVRPWILDSEYTTILINLQPFRVNCPAYSIAGAKVTKRGRWSVAPSKARRPILRSTMFFFFFFFRLDSLKQDTMAVG